jgi:Flp pilus assembly protein TadD/putative flippase GtrA
MQVTHIFGFTPSSQSGARADGTFGNATYLAVYMLMSAFITLYLLARRYREGALTINFQVWYGIALVLQLMGLYLTETRGAQLGLVGGIIVAAVWLAIFARDTKHRHLRRWSLYALGAIAALVLIFVGVRNTSFVRSSSALSRLADISLNDPTVASRLLYIWPTAGKGIAEKPLVGWGYENFNFVFNKYYQPQMYNQESWFDRAHNEFLDFGIWGGVPAMLIYLALFGLAVWTVWRANLSAPEQAVLVGLFAAYAFNNLFVFDNLVSYMYFFALLAFIASYAPARPPRFVVWARPLGEHGLAVAAPVALVALAFVGWYFNAPGIARARQLVSALSAQSGPAQNLAYFKQATSNTTFPGNPLGLQEAAEQLAQFTVNTVESSTIDPAVKQQYAAVSTDVLQREMAVRPHDARLELFMGSLLAAAGANNEALQYLEQAVSDSPQKQQILIQEGLLQIQTGDANAAIDTMHTAWQEEPDYDYARVMYAAAYYYAGRTAQGDQVLIDKWGTTIIDNDQLLIVYNNLKMYARSEAIWQLRIKQNPNDINLYLHLAQTYLNAGDKANTIATLQQAAKVQPALAGQVGQLIDAINNGTLKATGQ